ncbi:MAG: ubiquinone/menaquinone biosynthesis methyltransferase, partial [Verrucomicrobiota bacterium]
MGQNPEFVREAFSSIAPRYQLANHILSLGIDFLWREVTAKEVVKESPQRLLDVATGTGDLALTIQEKAPDLEMVATDFCQEMLDVARASGVKETMVADALDLPFASESFDVVTVAYGLRNMSSWPGGIQEMGRVLRPGGSLFVLDFSIPRGLLRKPYCFYLERVLPRIAGGIAGNREAYEYLAASIGSFPSGRAMEDLLCANGFVSATTRPLTGG